MRKGTAIAVFTKIPRPGFVKTRLQPPLTPREAAELHRACLQDTIALVARARGKHPFLFVAGSRKAAAALGRRLRLDARWHLRPQGRGDLGQRLERAMRALFASGFERILIIGTDTPWMGIGRIRRAARMLATAEVVIGPTADGGYYLLGAKRLVPSLFRRIPWGTAHVFRRTRRALDSQRIIWRSLPRDFDLDRPTDLRRVERMLRRGQLRAGALRDWLRKRRRRSASESSRRREPVRRSRKRRPGLA